MTRLSVDVDLLRHEIRRTYTDVSTDQEQEFIFPTGRAWARALGYPEPELSRVPDATVESFEKALEANDPSIPSSMVYAYAAIAQGIPYANAAPNLSADVPALLELPLSEVEEPRAA